MIVRFALLAASAALLPLMSCQAAAPNRAETSGKQADGTIESAVASPLRSPANKARDQFRHPAGTLAFFGVKPTDLVVEISPGGGWYTEILAPYVGSRGTLALVASERQLANARQKAAADPATFANVLFSPMGSWHDQTAFPAGSADVVLTFRNVHNWYSQGQAQDAFNAFFAMLKHGGTLGVVEHRLPESRADADMLSSGYMKQSAVVAMAQAAGFKLAASSEINANPRDSADYPDGVWTLPPSLQLGDKDRAKYLTIGESDRMTLRFVKPE